MTLGQGVGHADRHRGRERPSGSDISEGTLHGVLAKPAEVTEQARVPPETSQRLARCVVMSPVGKRIWASPEDHGVYPTNEPRSAS